MVGWTLLKVLPIIFLLFVPLIWTQDDCSGPRNCAVSEWGDWSECTETCGENGIQTRERSIIHEASCGGSCIVNITGQVPCGRQCCPQNCEYSQWSQWRYAGTSTNCKQGGERYSFTRTRYKTKNEDCGGFCDEQPLTETRCTRLICYQDCVLGVWSFWSNCKAPCEQKGTKKRTKPILREPKCGGKQCGLREEEVDCIGYCCPVDCQIGDWSQWSECNTQCGISNKTRTRSVRLPLCNGEKCSEDPKSIDATLCQNYVNVDCVVGPWSVWSDCVLNNGFCGEGTKNRTRSVVVPQKCRGKNCSTLLETGTCYGVCCRQDCVVSNWGLWKPCSSSCGQGISQRERKVDTLASCNGTSCPGLLESQNCSVTEIIHCSISDWSEWSECNNDCGHGKSLRTRLLLTPAYCGGNKCNDTKLEDEKSCESYAGKKDCKMSLWSSWGTCIRDCDRGEQTRRRTILQMDQCFGAPCLSTFENRTCHEKCSQLCNLGVCSCEPGYTLSSDGYSCSIISCPFPKQEYCPPDRFYRISCRYAYFNCPSVTYNSTCSPYCEYDWNIKADVTSIRCQHNGQWTNPEMFCVPPNHPPKAIKIDNVEINENTGSGKCVSYLSTTDDFYDRHEYTVIDDVKNIFLVKENKLCLKRTANFEEKPTIWQVTIRSTDLEGEFVDATFQFTILNSNDPPKSAELINDTVPENSPPGTKVGCLNATDDEPEQTLTIVLLDSKKNLFSSYTENGTVCIKVAKSSDPKCYTDGGKMCVLNMEEQKLNYITVMVMDDGDPKGVSYFDIPVKLTDANDRPTGVFLDPAGVKEGVEPGEALTTIKTVDEDEGQNYTYVLQDESGLFSIDGQYLVSTIMFNYEDLTQKEYEIQINSTDSGTPPLSITSTITFTVIDINESPYDLMLTSSNGAVKFLDNKPQIKENANAVFIGTITVKDYDHGDEVTLSLPDLSDTRLSLMTQMCSYMQGVNPFCFATLVSFGSFDYETEPYVNFSIKAIDKKGLEAEIWLQLEVLNVNDAPHDILLDALSTNTTSVFENHNDFIICNLTSVDQDAQDQHTFFLKDTDGGRFVIDGNLLKTSPTSGLDFEANAKHELTLQVFDNGEPSLSFEKVIIVDILDENETPTDILLSKNEVEENSEDGKLVGLLSTEDPDNESTDRQTFTYTLLDSGSNRFQIVKNELQVKKTAGVCASNKLCFLDYETEQNIDIKVKVTDNGRPSRSFEKLFSVKITNVNDPPQNIRLMKSIVRENDPAYTLVGKLTAVEEDEGQIMTFELLDNSDTFTIDNSALLTKAALNYEQQSTYNITVKVFDNGNPPASAVSVVTVTVLDINEAPEFLGSSSFTTPELQIKGTTIGNVTVRDPDKGDNLKIKISSGDLIFQINDVVCTDKSSAGTECVGALISLVPLSYEEETSHNVTITAEDKTGLTVTRQQVIVIQDVNEQPQDILFDGKPLNQISLPEVNHHVDICGLSAIDPDINQTHTFSIKSRETYIFEIVNRTLHVKFGASLDYEVESRYVLIIEVTDNGQPPLTLEKNITVIVQDVNEAPTSVTLDNVKVDENSDEGVTIGTFLVKDPDNLKETVQTFKFELLKSSDGRFKVTGDKLQVGQSNLDCSKIGGDTCSLNFEKMSYHVITVLVTDSGRPSKSSIFNITIQVTDVNDKPRDMKLSGYKIDKNAPSGTEIGYLRVSDEDTSQTHSFYLVDDASGQLAVDLDGKVTKATSSDLDLQKLYKIMVKAVDSGDPPQEIVGNFTITATGFDKAPPNVTFTSENGIAQFEDKKPVVKENTAIGTVIGSLEAVDRETNQQMTFDIESTGSQVLKVDSNVECVTEAKMSKCKVKILVAAELDFEQGQGYSLVVMVTDNDDMTAVEHYQLTIKNQNEAPTNLSFSGGSPAVEENLNNELLGVFTALDPDAGDSHTFELIEDGGGKFMISTAGRLSTTQDANLDFELTPAVTITLRVKDSGGLGLTKSFIVRIIDINEKPVNVTLSKYSVKEMSLTGTKVGTLTSEDPDQGQIFKYVLADDAGGRFVLDDNVVRVGLTGDNCKTRGDDSCLLDFETKSNYDIVVQTTDSGEPPLSATFTLNIKLVDVNDPPTGLAVQTKDLYENLPTNETIATIQAEDMDLGQSLSFSISGNDNRFSVVRNTILLSKPLDFETKSLYFLNIIAIDDGSPPEQISKTFEFKVLNVNEAPYNINLGSISGITEKFPVNKPTIAENSPTDTLIGQLVVQDNDNNDIVNFDTSNTDIKIHNQNCFALTKGIQCSADVYTAKTFDFETVNSTNLIFTATDRDGLSVSETIPLIIRDVNDPPTDIVLNGETPLSIAENSRDVTLTTLMAVDPDKGQSHTYSIQSDTNYFYVVNQNLRVASGADLDFESQASYKVTVRATDNGTPPQYLDKVFNINIEDVNERPGNLRLSRNKVPEDVSPDYLVGLLSADDPDNAFKQQQTLTFLLTDSASDRFKIIGNNLQVNRADFDYEMSDSYTIKVNVSDTGIPPLSVEEELSVSVIDANDAPTNLQLSATEIDENSPLDTVVGVLSADDEDDGQTLSFSLTSSVYFTVSDNQLLVHGEIDFERMPTIYVTANATDNGHPPKMVSKTFSIKVQDQNDAPSDIELEPVTAVQHMKIPESTSVGETIATITAFDPDHSDKLKFTLLDNTDGFVKLSSAIPVCGANTQTDDNRKQTSTKCSVQLEMAKTVNYENGDEKIIVSIKTEDVGGLYIRKKWTFEVVNSNEAPRDITIDGNITHIPENTPKFIIGALVTEDEDVGDKHIYQVITHWHLFSVQGNRLVAKAALDFEQKHTYKVTLKSTDNGSPPLSLMKTFTFKVSDINEKPTNISLNPNEVSNGAVLGDIVGIVKVTDPDNFYREIPVQTHNCTVGADGLGLFSIDQQTMKLKVTSVIPMDQSKINISISCTDSGTPPQKFTQDLVISVKETVMIPKMLVIKDQKKVPENSDSFLVGELQIINMLTKEPITGFFLFFLSDMSVPFTISGSQLSTNQKLNFEEKQEWMISVKAGGMDSHMNKVNINDTKLTIEVEDVNEAPYSIGIYGGGIVEENSKTGTLIGKLNTQDPEDYQSYDYTIIAVFPRLDISSAKSEYLDMFILKERTLTVGNATEFFDYEKYGFFSIMVQTKDSGSPPLSYNGTIRIVLQDANDPPSDISLSNNKIPEDSTAGAVIGHLSVTDEDKNQSHICEVVNLQGVPFKVKDDFKLVLVTNTLDYETIKRYQVKVECHDHGRDKSMLSIRKTFEINVTNVNEAPFDIGISNNIIQENNLIGLTVGELSVEDVDSDKVYFMVERNPSFELQGDNTLVTLKTFDYEVTSEYKITVTATDAEGASLSEEIIIKIEDVNEKPTDISLDKKIVKENSAPGTPIGFLSTEDQDRDKMFTYVVIETDTEKGYFEIEGDRLVAGTTLFDFEKNVDHRIFINSTDSSYPPLTIQKEFTITVEDMNEPPLDIILGTVTPIPEDAILKTVLSAIEVDDPDMDQLHICKVTSSNSPFLVITNENHEMNLVLNGVLDFEKSSSERVDLECSDGEFDIRKTVIVQVKNINEPPEFISLSGSLTIVANIDVGEMVGVLSVKDPDRNQTHTFRLEGPNSNILKVDKYKVIMAAKIPVTELYKPYPVIIFNVIATDNGNPELSVTETFKLPITNIKVVEQQLPAITLDNVEIPEDSIINFRIGKLYAHNESIGDNICFDIIDNPEAVFAIEDNTYLVLVKNLTEVEGTSRKITVQVKNLDTFKSESEEITIFIKRIDRCERNGFLCDENARCVQSDNSGHLCKCETGFYGNGSVCEDINYCIVRNEIGNIISENPCQNKGKCVDDLDKYTCICTDNYAGDNCEISKTIINPCSSSPCKNGGACILDNQNNTLFTCICETGWTGKFCEDSVNDCQSAVCYGNGSCIDKHRTYICQCPQERYGTKCQYLQEVCKGMENCKNGDQICVPKMNKLDYVCVNKVHNLVTLQIKRTDGRHETEEYKAKIIGLLTNFLQQQENKHRKKKRKKRDTSQRQKVHVYIVSLSQLVKDHFDVDFVVLEYPDENEVYSKEEVLDMLSKTCNNIKLSNLIENEICPGVNKVMNQQTKPEKESAELPIPIIAGAGGGAVVILVLIIVIVCVMKRRKSNDDTRHGDNNKKDESGNLDSRRSSGYASISKTKSPVTDEDKNTQNTDE